MRHRVRVLTAFRLRAAQTGSASEVFLDAVRLTRVELSVSLVGVFQLEEARDSLYLRVGAGWSADRTGNPSLRAGRASFGGHALTPVGAIVVECLGLHPEFAERTLSSHRITSALAVGIRDQALFWGAFGVFSRSQRMWTPDELEFARGVSGTIAAALYRERWARGQVAPNPRSTPTPDDWES
jgi:GAF domain-containing protein